MPGRVEVVLLPPKPEQKEFLWKVLVDTEVFKSGTAKTKADAEAEVKKVLAEVHGHGKPPTAEPATTKRHYSPPKDA